MNVTSLLLLLLAPVHGADVQPPIAVVPPEALRPAETPPNERPPTAWIAESLSVRITPGEEARVVLELELRGLRDAWADLAIVGGDLALSSATLDGRPVALPTREDAWRHLVLHGEGPRRLRVEGTVASLRNGFALPLISSPRTIVQVADGALRADVDGAIRAPDGRFLLPPTERLSLSWHPPRAPSPRPISLSATAHVGLSVDDAESSGRALLDYRIANGKTDTLHFRLPGRIDGLDVRGPAVGSFRRVGERVEVRLHEPTEGLVHLDVSWRAPAPHGERAEAAPIATPVDVLSLEGWVSLARNEEIQLVPGAGQGLQAVSQKALPARALGLVPGTPTSSWRIASREPSLDYQILRSSLVETPPTFVDEARYSVAFTEHGNLLFKAFYQVRNERRQYLVVRAPEGCRVIGVRVAGRTTQPVIGEDGAIRVPLEKSIESVAGLVSFPVEIFFFGRADAWGARGARTLRSPSVDAPVAYARWTLLAPPGYRTRFVGGSAALVQDWTEGGVGLQYGRAWRGGAGQEGQDEPPVEPGKGEGSGWGQAKGKSGPRAQSARSSTSNATRDARQELAQDYFNAAQEAYRSNRFDTADLILKKALDADPTHAASQSLQKNVEILRGETGNASGRDAGDEAQARRVRDLARARSTDQLLASEKSLQEAEDLSRAGDLAAAEEAWTRVLTLNKDLQQVEQKESREAEENVNRAALALEEIRNKRAPKAETSQKAQRQTRRTSSLLASLEARADKASGGDSYGDSDGDTDSDGIPDEVDLPYEDPRPASRRASDQGLLGILANSTESADLFAAFDELQDISGYAGLGLRGSGAGGGGAGQGAIYSFAGETVEGALLLPGGDTLITCDISFDEESPLATGEPMPAVPMVSPIAEPSPAPEFQSGAVRATSSSHARAPLVRLRLPGKPEPRKADDDESKPEKIVLAPRTIAMDGKVALSAGPPPTVSSPMPAQAPGPRRKADTSTAPPAPPRPAMSTVTAARLVFNLPEAGEPLLFEQRLLPADQPMIVELRYHARKKP